MKKIYMQPEFTTIDLGETATPLCGSTTLDCDMPGTAETNDVFSAGPSKSWEESSWKPADVFSDEEEL